MNKADLYGCGLGPQHGRKTADASGEGRCARCYQKITPSQSTSSNLLSHVCLPDTLHPAAVSFPESPSFYPPPAGTGAELVVVHRGLPSPVTRRMDISKR